MLLHLRDTTITVGYSALFGENATWDMVKERLAGYQLWEVVDILNRNSILLANAKGPYELEIQAQLCELFFGKDAPNIWARFVKACTTQQSHVLFCEQLQIKTARMAFLYLDVGPVTDSRSKDYSNLGLAMLMVSDLMQKSWAEIKPELGLYILTNHNAHKHLRIDHEFPRAFELYLTDAANLQNHPDYLDFPSLAKEITGLPPAGIAAGLWALMAAFVLQTNDAAKNQPNIAISRKGYFSQLRLPESEHDALFDLFCLEASKLKDILVKNATSQSAFDYWPFYDYPLVRFDEHVFCLTIDGFAAKSSEGIRSLYLQPKVPLRTRDKFLRFGGPLFQEYVDKLLTRAVSSRPNNLLRLDDYPGRTSGPIADFVVRSKKDVLVCEVKASKFSVKSLAEEDSEKINQRLTDIYLDGAVQIDATIKLLEAGAYSDLGFDPLKIRSYYPVIISLESNSMNWVVTPRIFAAIDSLNLLRQPKTNRLQNIDVAELEIIEGYIASGKVLSGMLKRKTASTHRSTLSFTNYWFHYERDTFHASNEFLSVRYAEILKEIEAWIQARGPGQN